MKCILLVAAVVPCISWANSEMEFAKVPKCEAWKLPKIDVRPSVDAEWHEAGDGTWFTNSVGEKISVERYCAVVNCTEEREVKPLLDKHYSRCQPNAIRKMYESDDERKDGSFWKNHFTCDKGGRILKGNVESQDELTAWRIAGNICLVHSADDTGRMRIRLYTFVLFDGEMRRTIVELDHLPDPGGMYSILSVRNNPDAVNNIAAMYYNDEAWTHSVDDDYVVRLLTIAAQFGSVTACENLAKLGRDRRWSKARVERWLYFAEACRDTIEAGHAPKMELKSISDWPLSWVSN